MKQTKKLWMLTFGRACSRSAKQTSLLGSRLIAAFAALTMTLGLASCVEHDNPVDPNPLAQQVKGMWYTQYDEEGTFGEDDFAKNYTRVINSLLLNEDGTGYGCTMYFNDKESNPVFLYGGYTLMGGAEFTYTTTTDGRITLKFNADDPIDKEYAKLLQSWNVTYADGHINCTSGANSQQLDKANDAMEAWLQSLFQQYAGGASAQSYNPNDVDFNHDTWRQQEAIYLYDGYGPETDDRGRKGYTLVNLPWYKEGLVESNLPMDFCDNITPENGWDLVMNYCGNTQALGANFFAVYNKWTGVLRIFTYVPQGFSAGNDHLWEVTLGGQFALKQGLNYGVPLDLTMADPSLLNLTGGYAQYVSPWVANRSTDGLLTPNAGWWAFDVDLSQYQPGVTISPTDQIRLQMRSWEKQQASFLSTITAGIDGTLEGDYKVTADPRASTMRATSHGIQAGIAVFGAFANAASGQFGLAANSMGSFVDHAFNCAMEAEGINATKTSFKGTINLAMNGNIDTEGIISGSKPVVGISSPTIPFSKFDTKNTLVGQGVWNLKTSPVVWLTSAEANFERLDNDWRDYKADMYYNSNDNGIWHVCAPNRASFYFFDPSSIEVELNPSLFPASDVEWTQVEAYCVSRADNGVRGTDIYRQAFGLQPRNQAGLPDATGYHSGHLFQTTAEIDSEDRKSWQLDFESGAHAYDFFYYMDQKPDGYTYPSVVSTPKYDGGRYDNGYYDAVVGSGHTGAVAIEPMVLRDVWRNDVETTLRTPALEVMVVLIVKLKSMETPLLYVRHYLPEVKQLWVNRSEFIPGNTSVWQNIKTRQPKGTGINRQSPTYDYEMLRIGKLLEYLNPGFKAE